MRQGANSRTAAPDMMLQTEMRGLLDAAGYILAEDIYSKENIPPYRRSIMDGYAVRSKDLGAAGDMIPTMLKVKERCFSALTHRI